MFSGQTTWRKSWTNFRRCKGLHLGQMICDLFPLQLMIQIFQGRCIPDLYDLYDPARVAGWEPYNLDDPGHVSWVGSVPYRCCATSHNGGLVSRWSIRRVKALPSNWNVQREASPSTYLMVGARVTESAASLHPWCTCVVARLLWQHCIMHIIPSAPYLGC